MQTTQKQFLWKSVDQWPPSSVIDSKQGHFMIQGVVKKNFPMRVRQHNPKSIYMQNDHDKDMKYHAVEITPTSIVRVSSTHANCKSYAPSQKFCADCGAPSDSSVSLSSTAFYGQCHDFLNFATGGEDGEELKADLLTPATEGNVLLWGAQDLPAELKSRLFATAQPLSPGTEVKIHTEGVSIVLHSLEITKAGPMEKVVTKTDEFLYKVDVRDTASEQFKDVNTRITAPKTVVEDAPVDDDEWD